MTNLDRQLVVDALGAILDDLADIEHERWSHWQRYMHDHGIRQADGSLLIPKQFVDRWDVQMNTTYEALSEQEKESDREQVRKYLPLIANTISNL
ncbi:hypothetical protein [Pigmentiphaga litoralis]|uniref:hypothetical protein n=1 Tax=Pigmentiphaga litoralis TaxID=516702 RepID=UPI00389A770E